MAEEPARRAAPRLLMLITGMFALRLLALALVDGLRPGFAADYCRWDCGWYLSIVARGYALLPFSDPAQPAVYSQANWAFFPLFPLLVRGVAALLPVSPMVAAFITANIFLWLFVVTAALYLPARRPGVNRLALAAFLLVFPYGLYFSVPYTESLFAFCATAALGALAANRLMPAAALAGITAASRVPGILFTPVVIVRAVAPARAWRAGRAGAAAQLAEALLPVALAPLGLAAYMAYLYVHMGDGLAFAHIQTGWRHHVGSPLATLLQNLWVNDWRNAFAQHDQSRAVSEVAALAGLSLSARLLLLRLWPEAWLLGGTVLLALSAGLISMQRYVFANPVFVIYLFEWLWCSAWVRRRYLALLAGAAAAQLYFAHCWIEGYAFLM